MQESKQGDWGPPPTSAGFEENSFPLLATGCTIDGTTGNASFTLAAGETLYLFKRVADGVVVANANVGSTSTECTFATTKKITVVNTAATNTHKVILDFYNGVFGQATSAASATAGSGPNIVLTLTGTGNTLKVRGTPNADILTMGTIGTTHYGSFSIYSAPATSPATRTFPDLSATGLTDVTLCGGPGNDVITGQGGGPVGGAAITAAGVTTSGLSGAINMAIYGGDGNDTITSGAAGAGTNSLYGNAGNDLFFQQPALAHDVISGTDAGGAADTDTVDYSRRTTAISVTLGDLGLTTPSTGYIDFLSAANTADHDNFTINDGTTTTTYEFQKTPNVLATGSITISGPPADNDTVTLNDGVNAAVTFVYTFTMNKAAYLAANPGFTDSDRIIDASTAGSDNDVAIATYNTINAYNDTTLTITAADPLLTSVVALTNNAALGASTVNQAVTKSGANIAVTGMSGGSHFTPVGGRTVIDITSGVTTDSQVATAAATAITGTGLTDSVVRSTDPYVTLSFAGVKPSGATITKGAGGFTVTDFSAGAAAATANDGQSGELDSIASDIENVIGTTADDVIDASRSTLVNHTLQGLAGNDTLIGSDLVDTIYGGAGDDVIKGGAGADVLKGGDNNDTMQGGTGVDNIDGGGVNCVVGTPAICVSTMAAAATNPGLNTNDFADRSESVTCTSPIACTVTAETDTVTVGSIAYIRGGAGADTLTGDASANIIWGGGRGDTIDGAGGADALYGDAGDDTINGGAGPDYITGGAGTNTLNGGDENDFIDNSAGTAGSVDCDSSAGNVGTTDVVVTNGSESAVLHCEN